MITYFLERPVFDFDVSWDQNPAKAYSYPLNARTLAYSLPRYERLQENTVQAVEFNLDLSTDAEIARWEEFLDNIYGRLSGFWFPCQWQAMVLDPGMEANSEFLIKDQGLFDWWEAHPSGAYLAFWKEGFGMLYGKIDSVEKLLNGLEHVVLDDTLSTNLDGNCIVWKLLYVRLTDDNEEAECLANGWQRRSVRVTELPLEYTAIEVGQIPVYLYEYFQVIDGVVRYWRLTGLNQDIVSKNSLSADELFFSKPMEHSQLKITTDAEVSGDLEVRGWREDANPLAMFVPFQTPTTLWLRIFEISYGLPDARKVIFTGKVLSVSPEGQFLTAKCASFLDVFSRKFPKFLLQPRCNYFVYDSNCRALVREAGGNILLIARRHVEVDLSNPPFPSRTESTEFNFFANGYCYIGSGLTREVRNIRQSSQLTKYATGPDKYKMTILLDVEFYGAHVGDVLQIVPGCDGSARDCQFKHFNFQNYGGHDNIPIQNPSVVSMNAAAPSGNKK